MTSAPDTTDDPRTTAIRDAFDSVYFLMFQGWSEEFRSNRWHFATRWARHLPVILVQPDLLEDKIVEIVEPEKRIPNTTILRVLACPLRQGAADVHRGECAIASLQILSHMRRQGHKRPLLWLYSPWLMPPFAWLPSAFRFMHLTEDWEHFPLPDNDLHRNFRKLARDAMKMADLCVAVSSGVADSANSAVPDARLLTVTNGCDFSAYSEAKPDAEIATFSATFDRVGVFAGSINRNIDFALLARAARRCLGTLFCMFGRETLTSDSRPARDELRACENVKFFGEVSPERIPSLYAAAHFGFIPYVADEHLRKSGFALKSLEMGAAGLPVACTEMQPLKGLAAAIKVTSTPEEFLDCVTRIDKRSMSEAESAELVSLARANDYDTKFDNILSAINSAMQSGPCGSSRNTETHANCNDWVSSELASLTVESLADDSKRSQVLLEFAHRYAARRGAGELDSVILSLFAVDAILKDGMLSMVPIPTGNLLASMIAALYKLPADDRSRISGDLETLRHLVSPVATVLWKNAAKSWRQGYFQIWKESIQTLASLFDCIDFEHLDRSDVEAMEHRVGQESRRADKEMKRANKLAESLAKADAKINSLKEKERAREQKSCKARFRRLIQLMKGRPDPGGCK